MPMSMLISASFSPSALIITKLQMRLCFYISKNNNIVNPRLTKPFFVTRLTKGGGYHPPCELENETPKIHVIGTIV